MPKVPIEHTRKGRPLNHHCHAKAGALLVGHTDEGVLFHDTDYGSCPKCHLDCEACLKNPAGARATQRSWPHNSIKAHSSSRAHTLPPIRIQHFAASSVSKIA